MAKTKQFEKVLNILRDASPNSVTKEDLATKLGKDVEMYRISTYIWEIKNKAQVDVDVVKDGRKVVGYMLADAVPVPVAENDEAVSEEVEEFADVATA